MKTILVIGSNSFTGAHFINHALKRGDRVIGISRSEEYSPFMLPYRYQETSGQFLFHQLDINQNLTEILKIADQKEPEIISNFAAQGEVRNSWKFPDQWYRTNCLGVVCLTEELRKRDYLKKYVTSSTPEVYGSTSQNLVENHNYIPSTPYAASKLAGDLHLITLYKRYGFPVVYTRSANVYGIHQQLYRIIPRTIIYLKLRKTLELHGEGKSVRSFIHINDVAEATMRVAEQGEPGEVYHVAPNNGEIMIIDLVKMICQMMNFDFASSVEMISENFGQDTIYSLNSYKIRTQLGWKTKVSLENGIQEMIAWIDDNWSEIQKMPLEYIHKS
jgi:dTDP-glucose 4,6-dehydratase